MSGMQDEDRDYGWASIRSNQSFEIKEKKMKPFSRMEAMQGKPVVTRRGKKLVWLIEVPSKFYVTYPLIGLIEGEGCPDTFTTDGFYFDNHDETSNDLFMGTVIKEGWIAYGLWSREGTQVKDGAHLTALFCTHVWETEEQAVAYFKSANCNAAPLGIKKIVWEE